MTPIASAALRAAGLLAGAGAAAGLHAAGAPLPTCPWRAATGLPCPLCGATTAAVALAHLDLEGAVRASPLVLGGAAAVAAMPLLRGRFARTRPRIRMAGLVAVLALSEIWQLARFGML